MPLLLKFPSFSNVISGYSMIGYGDVVLPGLFIMYLHNFDKCLNQSFRFYYSLSLLGYVTGKYLKNKNKAKNKKQEQKK